jgi:hypothetical protein
MKVAGINWANSASAMSPIEHPFSVTWMPFDVKSRMESSPFCTRAEPQQETAARREDRGGTAAWMKENPRPYPPRTLVTGVRYRKAIVTDSSIHARRQQRLESPNAPAGDHAWHGVR